MRSCNYCERSYEPLTQQSAPDSLVMFFQHGATPKDQRINPHHFCSPDCLYLWLFESMPQAAHDALQTRDARQEPTDTRPVATGGSWANNPLFVSAVRSLIDGIDHAQQKGWIDVVTVAPEAYLAAVSELERAEQQQDRKPIEQSGITLPDTLSRILVRYVGSVKGLMACLAEFGQDTSLGGTVNTDMPHTAVSYCREHYDAVEGLQEAIEPLTTVLEALDTANTVDDAEVRSRLAALRDNTPEDWTEKGIRPAPVAITPDEVRELQRKRSVDVADKRVMHPSSRNPLTPEQYNIANGRPDANEEQRRGE